MLKSFDRAELENSIIEDIEKAIMKKRGKPGRIGKIAGYVLGLVSFGYFILFHVINWESVLNMFQ
ncbi:hypothetical protein D1872_218160 [compost metagenome]